MSAARNRWKWCCVFLRSSLMLLAAAVSSSGSHFLPRLLIVISQITDGSGNKNHSLDGYSVETWHLYNPLHWFWQWLPEVIQILWLALIHSPDGKSAMLVQSTCAHPTWLLLTNNYSKCHCIEKPRSFCVSVDLHLYPLTAHFVKWAKITVMTARVTGKTTVV